MTAPRRRWFQFSLATLLAVLLAAGPLILIARWYSHATPEPGRWVHPAIAASELATIQAAITAKSQLTEKEIFYIELIHPSVVLAAGGNWSFVFHKTNGVWVMTKSDPNKPMSWNGSYRQP